MLSLYWLSLWFYLVKVSVLSKKAQKVFLSQSKSVFLCRFFRKMANKYEELTHAFETKLRKLISEYKSLQEQNTLLKADLERKQTDLMVAHQEILELRKNYDHLQLAKNMLGGSEAAKAESKQQIAKMVREIDKCLALLDE